MQERGRVKSSIPLLVGNIPLPRAYKEERACNLHSWRNVNCYYFCPIELVQTGKPRSHIWPFRLRYLTINSNHLHFAVYTGNTGSCMPSPPYAPLPLLCPIMNKYFFSIGLLRSSKSSSPS